MTSRSTVLTDGIIFHQWHPPPSLASLRPALAEWVCWMRWPSRHALPVERRMRSPTANAVVADCPIAAVLGCQPVDASAQRALAAKSTRVARMPKRSVNRRALASFNEVSVSNKHHSLGKNRVVLTTQRAV